MLNGFFKSLSCEYNAFKFHMLNIRDDFDEPAISKIIKEELLENQEVVSIQYKNKKL